MIITKAEVAGLVLPLLIVALIKNKIKNNEMSSNGHNNNSNYQWNKARFA